MGLILTGAILVLFYIAKIFFPEFVVEVAQIERITVIGSYIDTHKWAWYFVSSILSFITYYLLCCACASKKKLNVKEIFIIIVGIAIIYLCKEFLPKYYTTINYISMIALPCLTNGKMLNSTICFTALNLLQIFTLEIRNIVLMVATYNYATFTILTIDYYILQFLLYFFFNTKKGE